MQVLIHKANRKSGLMKPRIRYTVYRVTPLERLCVWILVHLLVCDCLRIGNQIKALGELNMISSQDGTRFSQMLGMASFPTI